MNLVMQVTTKETNRKGWKSDQPPETRLVYNNIYQHARTQKLVTNKEKIRRGPAVAWPLGIDLA